MRKTTYLSNDTSQSVHAFKSLAQTRLHLDGESEKRLREKQQILSANEYIEQTFDIANRYAASLSSNQEEKRDEHPLQKKARIHPTKKHVVAIAEYPLFPNTMTWNKTCIHVAMDHLPKKVGDVPPPSYAQMQKALIMDVQAKDHALSTRMECNILVPKQISSSSSPNIDASMTKHDFTTVHKYDLEVVHVKEDSSGPLHNTFLFVMDKINGVSSYHPISSRVNLSSGRPISIQERNRKNTVWIQPQDFEKQDDNDDDEMEEDKVDVKTSHYRKSMKSVVQEDDSDDSYE